MKKNLLLVIMSLFGLFGTLRAQEAPAAPVVKAEATSDTTIVLAWDKVADATAYKVYSADTLVANVTDTTLTVDGLVAETEYTFAVTALNGELESERTEAKATTLKAEEEGEEGEGDDEEYLICERFDNYEEGDKIAEKGADCWTTWSREEGGKTDGEIALIDGNKCARIKYGNDQVLILGDYITGCYEIEFDVYVPNGKSGYYNILNKFDGSNSVWAMQAYLHMEDDGGQTQKQSAGHGTIHAGGNSAADMECVYDAWMHLRFVVDIDRDTAQMFYTKPEAEETKVIEWQWSKGSFGESEVPERALNAMNFYPPLKTSDFYLDNITLKKLSGETAPEISFAEETVKAGAFADDFSEVEITFENTGTSIADYTAWIDYGTSAGGDGATMINYDAEISDSTTVLGLGGITEPTLVELGAMYPASSYASSVAGTKITHICYPFVEIEEGVGYGIVEGSDVVFRIYGQGYNGMPGEVLAEKVVPYSEIKNGDFLLAEFDEPVVLTGFNVWATVSLMQEVSTQSKPQFPLIFDGMTGGVIPYGDLIRIGHEGPFFFAHETFSKSYGNIHIRIACMGDPVLGGWAELDKVDGVLPIGETATLNVSFNTYGLEGGKTYEAKVVFAVNSTDELFEVPLALQIWGENVEEVLNNDYNIYPNPTTGMVTVEGENIDYVAVYNSLGQLVKVVKTQSNVVDMSSCDNGVYFFSVVDNAGKNSVQRVVVAK